MTEIAPVLDVRFFCTDAGNEPVREWLTDLPRDHHRLVGTDIKTAIGGHWTLGQDLQEPICHKRGSTSLNAALTAGLTTPLITSPRDDLLAIKGSYAIQGKSVSQPPDHWPRLGRGFGVQRK